MNAGSGPIEGDLFGHVYAGKQSPEGYGICHCCGCRENTEESAEKCPEGSVKASQAVKLLRQEIRELRRAVPVDLEDIRARVHDHKWMPDKQRWSCEDDMTTLLNCLDRKSEALTDAIWARMGIEDELHDDLKQAVRRALVEE